MREWVKKNLRNIIVGCFIIPILLVAFVSISHVTTMYELSNPIAWSVYLSVAIEIAALSALAAVSVRMGNFIYIPFIIVTLIQFLGNLFFAYSFIDETSIAFKNWVELVGPLFEPLGYELTDIPSQKRILAFFTGGLLPFISLTFAHMLVVFTEKNKLDDSDDEPKKALIIDDIEELSKEASKWEQENEEEPKPIVLNEEELAKLEDSLKVQTEKVVEETQPDEKEIKTLKYVKDR